MHARHKIAVAGATGRVGSHVVDVLQERGHDVVPISRSDGVDVVTGNGLAEALAGVVFSPSMPLPALRPKSRQRPSSSRRRPGTCKKMGVRAGVQRIVVVSIIGVDRFTSGYGAAKQAHERAMLTGPIPVGIVRAAQFHELVSQLIDWGGQGRVRYLPNMRTQLVAARAVAETLADVATEQESAVNGTAFLEIAGPREEKPRRGGASPHREAQGRARDRSYE